MVVLKGKSVFGDICMGELFFYRRGESVIKRHKTDDADAETARFKKAKEEAKEQLLKLYEKALHEVGEDNAAIFEIHRMMLDDEDYCESVENIIRSQFVNAEYAVGVTADNFAEMFSSMDDAYMQARAADVRDISERIVKILSGADALGSGGLSSPAIIAADDLAPSETVQLDRSKVLGFVMQNGSANSHTAILGRSMGIPSVIGVGDGLSAEYDGKFAIVDGFDGVVYIDPDAETISKMEQKRRNASRRKELLQELKGKESVTLDGRKIKIYANIGNVSDTVFALQNDAEGIGLFRSEFLYLENDDFPTEEQQFAAYKAAAEKMSGKKVIIRTLDIGADKQAPYFGLDKEENPALGFRAIRICLTRTDIFKTQLRAILRAALYGNISVMFPMIISVDELRRAKSIMEEAKSELRAENIPFKEEVETGIMIETPAAVMISDELAKEADFFSVGTNDLTQYTLAIDRQNQKLEPFYDAHHPAVLKMIEIAANNAHKEGKWIGICGELGADLLLTERFLQMSIDELSVSPSMVLEVRKKVRETDLSKF